MLEMDTSICHDMSESTVEAEKGIKHGGAAKKRVGFVNGSGRSGCDVGGTGAALCQAQGCEVDLSEAKRYYQRHKLCEVHAKAEAVIVAGLRQRFCQQCSRFHELSEFDDSKRSCRRRLAGHNERRRKSSTEPPGEGSSAHHRSDVIISNKNYQGQNDEKMVDNRYRKQPPIH